MTSLRPLSVVVVALLVGCGGEEPSADFTNPPEETKEVEASKPASLAPNEPPTCDRNTLDCLEMLGEYLAEQEGHSGRWETAFVTSYQTCSIFSPEEFVEQGFGTSSDPSDVAQAYAEETYIPAAQPAAFTGCLDAFLGLP
jgi:hypothetical protein